MQRRQTPQRKPLMFGWSRLILKRGFLIVGITACSLSNLVDGGDLPSDVRDPSALATPAAAMGKYYRLMRNFSGTIGGGSATTADSVAVISPGNASSWGAIVGGIGLWTDELISDKGRDATSTFPSQYIDFLDARVVDGSGTFVQDLGLTLFSGLNSVRGWSRETRGSLQAFLPSTSGAFVGHTYAIEGMSEVLLAEIFCSGIPLSRFEYDENFILKPGSTTEDVLSDAVRLFDSAINYAHDSVDIVRFAQLGKGRALLGLGKYTEAAQAVQSIPDDWTHTVTYSTSARNVFVTTGNQWIVSVADRKGGNGFPYVSSNDPRTATIDIVSSGTLGIRKFPLKYVPSGGNAGENPGLVPIVVASGIEARLIEAEADLATGQSQWLSRLNALRTTCIAGSLCPSPAPPGTGGVAGLSPLDDPGSDSSRVALLFNERAAWLFLTGHRLGDLRRLIRQYSWPLDTVFPMGSWSGTGFTVFGGTAVVPVPKQEAETNPLYHGCFSEDA